MKKVFLILFILTVQIFANELKFDEKIIRGELGNGIKYFVMKNKTPKNTAFAYLYVKTGSINEEENEKGLAHFTEHMVFNGSEDFNDLEIVNVLESLGVKFGADLNAATSFTSTVYNLEIDAKKLETGLKVLANMAYKATFDEKQIEKEKGVIIEEDRLRNGAFMRIFKQELPLFYYKSDFINRLPIGDMEIVKSANKKIFQNFYAKNYAPELLNVVVVGDVDENQTINLIKQNFSSHKKSKISRKDEYKKIEKWGEFLYLNSFDKEISQEEIRLFFEDDFKALKTTQDLKQKIIKAAISYIVSLENSKFLQENLMKNEVGFGNFDFFNQKQINYFGMEVNGEFDKNLEEFFKFIGYLKKIEISDEMLELVKNELLAKNQEIFDKKNSKNSSYLIDKILDFISDGHIVISENDSYNLTKEILQNLSKQDIKNEMNKIFSQNGSLLEIVSKEELKFSKKQIEDFRNVKSFDNFKIQKLPKSLITNEPKSKKFISKKFDEKTGFYKYEFENGAKISLKILKTRENSVNYDIFAKGGYTNLTDNKTAQMALILSNSSGLGDFNAYETQKITQGQIFSLSRYMDKISRGISGKSISKDLKHLFEAIYVSFQNPKIDKKYAKNIIEKNIKMLKSNEKNPQTIFLQKTNSALYDNNEKYAYLKAKDWEGLNLKNASEILKNLYGNIGEFEGIFVGDLDLNEFENLICKFIGSLENSKKIENEIKDDSVNYTQKPVLLENFLDTQNKLTAFIYIVSNPKIADYKNNIKLIAANSIFSVLLRENIREENSQVYSIYSHTKLNKLPNSYALTHIYYTSDPKNKNFILDEIKKISSDLTKNGISQKYLDNFKIQTIIDLKKSYEEPNFWTYEQKNSILFNNEFLSLDEKIAVVNSLEISDINNALKELFKNKNLFISFMLPKK